MTFLGHETNGHKLVVDHINGDKSDDRVKTLELVTNRANTLLVLGLMKSLLVRYMLGVSWSKRV